MNVVNFFLKNLINKPYKVIYLKMFLYKLLLLDEITIDVISNYRIRVVENIITINCCRTTLSITKHNTITTAIHCITLI